MRAILLFVKRWLEGSDSFTRSLAWIGSSTAAAQGIQILSLLALTRLYTAEALGHFAIFLATSTLVSGFVTLRYELAIPLPDEPLRSAQLVILSGICALLGGSLFYTLLVIQPHLVVHWFRLPEKTLWVWMLPLSAILTSLTQSFYFFALRQRQFRQIALARLLVALTTASLQVGGAFFWGTDALILGVLFGQTFQIIILARCLPPLRYAWRGWQALYALALRYRRFPQFYLWSGLISGINLQVPLLLLSYFFGTAASGYYALAYRILNAPLSLLGQSIGHAYLNATLQERSRIAELTHRLYTKQILLSMPFGLLFGILGTEIIATIFGSSWQPAGKMTQWMVPLVLLSFVSNTFTELFTLYEKQLLSIILQITLLLQRLLSILIAAWITEDLLTVVAVFSGSGVLVWGGFLIWVMRTTGNSVSAFFTPLCWTGWWLGMAILIMMVKYFPSYFTAVIAILAGVGIMIFYLRATIQSPLFHYSMRPNIGYHDEV